MNILLLGHHGQVGFELQRALAPLGTVTSLDFPETDFLNLDQLAATVRKHNPVVIVNAAAYTAVDKAESDSATAHAINGAAVGVLAAQAKQLNALLVHYSTDYVFNGSGTRPWVETDTPQPLSVYGHSKLAGETAIRNSGCDHFILRTSWVYAARGQNFVRTILRLAGERDSLSVINDQIGAPTYAGFLADSTARIIECDAGNPATRAARLGTYHITSRGEASWHDLASHAVQCALDYGATLKVTPERIVAITTSQYPLPAPRPSNSRMCVDKFEGTFGITCPDWRTDCRNVVNELIRGANT
jgi:dTDP-4-dehydrorhamnose reductase